MHSCCGLPQHVLIFYNLVSVLTITDSEKIITPLVYCWTYPAYLKRDIELLCYTGLSHVCSDSSQYLSVLNNILH